jgi:hypothetical protein
MFQDHQIKKKVVMRLMTDHVQVFLRLPHSRVAPWCTTPRPTDSFKLGLGWVGLARWHPVACSLIAGWLASEVVVVTSSNHLLARLILID